MGDRLCFVAALCAAGLLCGCETTHQIKGYALKSGIRTPTTPDPITFEQVPVRNRGGAIAAAEALRLSRERHKLAELREELTKIEAELAKVESAATASRLSEKTALFKKSQFEAIDLTRLGDKEENIAAIGKLASRAAKHESDALKDESRATILKRRADQRRVEVDAQAKKVAGLEGVP